MGKRPTQCEMILEYIEKHGNISQLEAYTAIRCTRLPARVSDLRKAGHHILGKRVSHKAADGKGSNFTRYYMGDVNG